MDTEGIVGEREEGASIIQMRFMAHMYNKVNNESHKRGEHFELNA